MEDARVLSDRPPGISLNVSHNGGRVIARAPYAPSSGHSCPGKQSDKLVRAPGFQRVIPPSTMRAVPVV